MSQGARGCLAWAAAGLLSTASAAMQTTVPPKGPAVSMRVTGPDGTARDLTTHESGLATLDVNGHQYGFRPTMHDDAGTSLTVTIFDMGGAQQPVKELAAVELRGGGPAMATSTSPAFRVSARKGAASTAGATARPPAARPTP